MNERHLEARGGRVHHPDRRQKALLDRVPPSTLDVDHPGLGVHEVILEAADRIVVAAQEPGRRRRRLVGPLLAEVRVGHLGRPVRDIERQVKRLFDRVKGFDVRRCPPEQVLVLRLPVVERRNLVVLACDRAAQLADRGIERVDTGPVLSVCLIGHRLGGRD